MKNTLLKSTVIHISFLVLILSFNIANAYPRHAMNRIHPGMHPAQVRSILGNPQKIIYLANRKEQWYYPENQYPSRTQGTKILEFKRGQVVALFDKKLKHFNKPYRQTRARYYRRPQVVHCHSCYPCYPVPRARAIRHYPGTRITPVISLGFGATI